MKRFPYFVLALLILCVLLVSCSSTGWVSNPYNKYSSDDYVCAVGRGKTIEEADLSARQELAALFGMSVSSTTSLTVIDTSATKDGNKSESYGEFFTSNSSVVVNADNLYGVEIAKRTVEDNGTHISLAVMPKKTTSEYYLARIESDRHLIENLKQTVAGSLGTFKGVEIAAELVRSCNDYNTSVVMCNFLSGNSIEFMSLSESKELYRKACSSIVLEVVVSGDDSGAIKSSISKVFTEAGFAVSNGSLVPTAKAVATIVWRETAGTGAASDFVFANYNADVSVVDLAGNATVFVFSASDKEGHQDYESARARAISGLSKILEDEFREELNSKYTY